MSFFKCCVGADPRPPPEAIRPVGSSSIPNNRSARAGATAGGSSLRPDSLGGNKKLKKPNEVFFDPTKPDGQLSSITDPPNSAREHSEGKKKKDAKDRGANGRRDSGKVAATADDKSELDVPDNNGLTRGQNFMKVEKWLRNACMYQQIEVTPGVICNLEDPPTDLSENTVDPPSEKDRLPPAIVARLPSTNSR